MKKNSVLLLMLIFLNVNSYAITVQTDGVSATVDERGIISFIEDAAITAQIMAKVALDKSLSDNDIDVQTHNGTVIITGTVNSHIESDRLVELANTTSGVKQVDISHLKIKPSTQPLTDLYITLKVKILLFPSTLHVETHNGVVYLTGKATNSDQIDRALELAKSVKGTVRVVSVASVVTKE